MAATLTYTCDLCGQPTELTTYGPGQIFIKRLGTTNGYGLVSPTAVVSERITITWERMRIELNGRHCDVCSACWRSLQSIVLDASGGVSQSANGSGECQTPTRGTASVRQPTVQAAAKVGGAGKRPASLTHQRV